MTTVRVRTDRLTEAAAVPSWNRLDTRVPLLLRSTSFLVFVFPANMVLEPLGAVGHVAMILSLALLVFWVVSAFLGLHDPIGYRHPSRIALAILLLVTCFSFGALALGLTGGSTIAGRSSADRWLILILASIAIALTTSEVIRTIDDALVLFRALLAGAFVCCVIAVVQFFLHINPMEWVQTAMVGFVDNGGNTPFQLRGSLMRVAGSTFHPIELGVVSAMLLPISVWRALYDRSGWKPLHWLGTALLLFASAATVSRSSVIGLLIAAIVSIPFLPSLARKWAVVIVPVAVAGLFLGMPGLMATLFGSFSAGTADPSITTRLDNYPRVVQLVSEHPWTGSGPGTYLPKNALELLDNQYLHSAVELGIPGALAIACYLILPGASALLAARFARGDALRSLAGAVAASCFVASAASATFDSLSFPVFALLYPLFVGLSGAVWLAVKRERAFIPTAVGDAFVPAVPYITQSSGGDHGSRVRR